LKTEESSPLLPSAQTKADVPALQMEDVTLGSIQDPRRVVAEGINWTVAVGDYWVVAGGQGAGKTDLFMMAGGLMAPLSGRYRLFGEDMPIFEAARLKGRLRVGLVFDGGQLLHRLTVRENVALPLCYHHHLTEAQAQPRVQAMLDWLDLGPWADNTPATMPRNWQKRAGLARALILRPEALLADNPLGGLDVLQRSWWLAIFEQLSKGHGVMEGRPVTLAVSAADLRPWRRHARLFAILKNQRLTVLGGWEQVEKAEADVLHGVLEERHLE